MLGSVQFAMLPKKPPSNKSGFMFLGVPPDITRSEDSIVRTHARLLRQKLTEYFAGEGATEQIMVEIPKGHYLPTSGLWNRNLPSPGPIGDASSRRAQSPR